MLQFTIGGASSLLLQCHHGPNTGVHLQSQIISILTNNWSLQLNNSKVIKWLIYMLRKLDAFHCNIKGWWVFVPGVHPPPLKRLDCFRLPLCPRWRTVQLEAKFTINIQYTICTNNLVDTGENMYRLIKLFEATSFSLLYGHTTIPLGTPTQSFWILARACQHQRWLWPPP